MTVPAFPLIEEPGTWPDLTLVAATVFLEAEGEPEIGQIGVAHVIATRMERMGVAARHVVLGPDGQAWTGAHRHEPFSCWDDEAQDRARARLAAAPDEQAARAWKAAAAGYWRLTPDPSMGAWFYLNVPLTRNLRGGTLPTWFDPAKVTAEHGRHTFLLA